MKVTDAQITALQETVILLNLMHLHAKDPILLCYYRFLRDNVARITSILTSEQEPTPDDVFKQLDLHLDN